MENVVSNIKAFRKAKGITQEELAKSAGINKISICRYENGERHPRIEHLIAIYNALGIKLTLTYEAIVEEDSNDQRRT